jgi:dTMP kinase
MAERGRFVVLEGGEGSGKSTQTRLLAARLGARATREPGGTALGEELRRLVLSPRPEPVAARAELLLMAAARAQHVAEVVRPALEAGEDVVSDRFSGSTLAYQAYGRGLPLAEVEAACHLASDGLEPDLVVLLDLSPEVGAARRAGGPDRIEAAGPAFHARVRDGFLAIAATAPERWVVLDASRPADEIAEEIARLVDDRLGGATGPRGAAPAGSTRRGAPAAPSRRADPGRAP